MLYLSLIESFLKNSKLIIKDDEMEMHLKRTGNKTSLSYINLFIRNFRNHLRLNLEMVAYIIFINLFF